VKIRALRGKIWKFPFTFIFLLLSFYFYLFTFIFYLQKWNAVQTVEPAVFLCRYLLLFRGCLTANRQESGVFIYLMITGVLFMVILHDPRFVLISNLKRSFVEKAGKKQ